VRLYARYKRSDALVAALSPRFKRPFWRKRVDRSGFNVGLYSGPVVGWHKRLTRALPENWPLNEPIPENAVQQNEQSYMRFYWLANIEFGWTFNGRVNLALGIAEVFRFESFPEEPQLADPTYEADQASYAFNQPKVTTSLSVILGRKSIKVP